MGWLSKHLQDFVQPVLGYVPTTDGYSRLFTPEEMAVLKNMWRSVKQEAKRLQKPILLAGRDVYLFEILARREGTPTVFRPDISRLTVGHVTEDYTKHYLFDTGFMGSIPKALNCESYTMGSSNSAALSENSYSDPLYQLTRGKKHTLRTKETHQVFPRMKGARSLILKIERTPKYWKRGFYRGEECNCKERQLAYPENPGMCYWCNKPFTYEGAKGIFQETSNTAEFLAAALLTIEIYKDSSPGFVEKPVNVTSHSVGVNYFE